MKGKGRFIKRSSLFMIVLMTLIFSCHQNEFTNAVLAHIQSEAISDSFQNETVDISSVAMNNTTETLSGGRYGEGSREIKGIGTIDDRFKGAVVTHIKDPASTLENPIGTITIDFGTGCADAHGKTRKGMIVIHYSGKRFSPGSTITVTVQNFYKNDAHVEGTLTLTGLLPSTPDNTKFQVVTSGKLIFPDGRQATREQSTTHELFPDPKDLWIVTGHSSGTNKNGKSYTMKITSELVYSKTCELNSKVFIPVKGIKTLTVDHKEIIIDYGDGSCDNTVTITVNGRSKVETLTDGK